MKNILTLLCIFLLSVSLYAQKEQKTPQESIVTLKKGETIRGEITEYIPGEFVKIKVKDGPELRIPANQVRSIDMASAEETKGGNSYEFKEKGMFNSLQYYRMFWEDRNEILYSLGLQHVIGHQFNRLFGIGAGLGIDVLGQRLYMVPIYAHVRGYFLKKPFTPLYRLDVGYAAPLKANLDPNSVSFYEQRGGLIFNPAFGVRFKAKKKINFTLDAGFKYQTYTLREKVSGFGYTTNLKALSVRFGLLF